MFSNLYQKMGSIYLFSSRPLAPVESPLRTTRVLATSSTILKYLTQAIRKGEEDPVTVCFVMLRKRHVLSMYLQLTYLTGINIATRTISRNMKVFCNKCMESIVVTRLCDSIRHRRECVTSTRFVYAKLLLRYGICLVHDNRFQGIIARPITHNFNSHDVVNSINHVSSDNGGWL